MLSVAEYLEMEAQSPVRHEYVHGKVFALAGGTVRHNVITGNIFANLKSAERASGCRTFVTDVKVRAAADIFYYPDVAVECVPRDDASVFIDQPCLIVEVSSRGTRRTDHGEKLDNYRGIPSVLACVLVEQSRRCVLHHFRGHNGEWHREEVVGSGSLSLRCPVTTLTLDQIYEGVALSPLGVAENEPLDNEYEAGELRE